MKWHKSAAAEGTNGRATGRSRASARRSWPEQALRHPTTRGRHRELGKAHNLLRVQGLDFFGGRPLREEDTRRAAEWERETADARIVILADLWLDRPDTLPKLERVLDGAQGPGFRRKGSTIMLQKVRNFTYGSLLGATFLHLLEPRSVASCAVRSGSVTSAVPTS